MTDQLPAIPTIQQIQEFVARGFRVTVLDILSRRRDQPTTYARQVAMWLCRHATLHSLSEIGRAFGDKDRTTVFHAIKRVDEAMAVDPQAAAVMWQLLHSVNNGCSVDTRRARLRVVASEGDAA